MKIKAGNGSGGWVEKCEKERLNADSGEGDERREEKRREEMRREEKRREEKRREEKRREGDIDRHILNVAQK